MKLNHLIISIVEVGIHLAAALDLQCKGVRTAERLRRDLRLRQPLGGTVGHETGSKSHRESASCPDGRGIDRFLGDADRALLEKVVNASGSDGATGDMLCHDGTR